MALKPKHRYVCRLATLLLAATLCTGLPLDAHGTEDTPSLENAAQTVVPPEAKSEDAASPNDEGLNVQTSTKKTDSLPTEAQEETSAAAEEAEDPAADEGSYVEEDVTVAPSAFSYQHDPRDNPSAMKDIMENPLAIYGFSPRPDGSLKQYADADWTDPALVELARQNRIEYHEGQADLHQLVEEMMAKGATTEEIARAVSTKRNENRMASYVDNPEGLAMMKARNLEQYGNEMGGTPDYFYEKYGSWEKVIEKSMSVNSGMDACVGLYDENYGMYVATGQVPADEPAVAPDESATESEEPAAEDLATPPAEPATEIPVEVAAEPNVAAPLPASAAPAALPATGDELPNAPLAAVLAGSALAVSGLALRRRGNKAA